MKIIFTAVLFLTMTTTAFAGQSEPREIVGETAIKLMMTLHRTGSAANSGVGRIFSEIKDVSCSASSLAAVNMVCDARIQSETGNLTQTSISGVAAEELAMSLMDSGLYGCSDESCGGTAKSISCWMPLESKDGSESSCMISQ